MACLVLISQGHALADSQQHSVQPLAVSVAADKQGKLWQVRIHEGQVRVAASEDAGQHFGQEVAVNTMPMPMPPGSDTRAAIAVDSHGNLYLSWNAPLKPGGAGAVWFVRSLDGGKSFAPPYIVHQYRETRPPGSVALQMTAEDALMVIWSDTPGSPAGKSPASSGDAAIMYAVSTDQGKSFHATQTLDRSRCDCCQMALASQADGKVAILWQQVFDGGEGDHALTEISPTQAAEIVRVSHSRTKVQGCAQQGAALSVGEGFGYHLAYIDSGKKPGLRIARMDRQAWVTSPPRRIGNPQKNADHPALLSMGDQVWLAWREHDSQGAEIVVMHSLDAGRTWGPPVTMLHSRGRLDVPQWLQLHEQAWLAVNTADKGLVVMRLPRPEQP